VEAAAPLADLVRRHLETLALMGVRFESSEQYLAAGVTV
jgi:hypothetical protein